MDQKLKLEWDPRCEAVLKDQLAAYDDLRHRCPVAHSELLNWSLFRHEDVLPRTRAMSAGSISQTPGQDRSSRASHDRMASCTHCRSRPCALR